MDTNRVDFVFGGTDIILQQRDVVVTMMTHILLRMHQADVLTLDLIHYSDGTASGYFTGRIVVNRNGGML